MTPSHIMAPDTGELFELVSLRAEPLPPQVQLRPAPKLTLVDAPEPPRPASSYWLLGGHRIFE